jgi:ribosomal protein S18 acetylase RimI-like enzyme
MTQPLAVESPPPPKPSDLAQPEVSYQWELLSSIAGEMWPLFVDSYKESHSEHEDRPLDPNWQEYINLQVQKRLPIITARINGKLVGYIIWIVFSHLHHKTEKQASADTYYVKKEYRSGYNIGKEMFDRSDNVLRDMGCKDILVFSRNDFSTILPKFFRKIGFSDYGGLFFKRF